jgi:hypothetical protein
MQSPGLRAGKHHRVAMQKMMNFKISADCTLPAPRRHSGLQGVVDHAMSSGPSPLCSSAKPALHFRRR